MADEQEPLTSLVLGLDLEAAAAKVLKSVATDPVPDVIRYADWIEAWPERRTDLEHRLRDGSYRPHSPEVIEVPKSSLAFRPIAVLDMSDRILYQAILDVIAEDVDSLLGREVMSARIKKDKRGRLYQVNQVRAWVAYERKGRELYDSFRTTPLLLTTDITSYFEYIDIDKLISDLRGLLGDKHGEIVDLLGLLLHRLTRNTALNGIPQGHAASAILGNFYLRTLDEIVRKLDLPFIRFQDDISVFCEQETPLRQAVYRMTQGARLLRLNLASAKTKILAGEKALANFEDLRKDAIEYLMQDRRAQITTITRGSEGFVSRRLEAITELHAMFEGAVEGAAIRDRDVRFSVSRMSQMNDPYAVEWILANLGKVPYLAPILVPYLSRYLNTRPDIEIAVREFLQDRSANIVDHAEMELIRMFANARNIGAETYAMLWTILRDGAKSSPSRQFTARAIARHMVGGRRVDLDVLRLEFDAAQDLKMKRALLVALKEAGDAERRFLDDVAAGNPELAHTCRYLRKDPHLPDP